MAFKTLTVDVQAYELLRARKRPGQSFSALIKESMGRGGTARDLLRALEVVRLESATLDAIDLQVAERGADPARAADL